jgi:hypothetical protein
MWKPEHRSAAERHGLRLRALRRSRRPSTAIWERPSSREDGTKKPSSRTRRRCLSIRRRRPRGKVCSTLAGPSANGEIQPSLAPDPS